MSLLSYKEARPWAAGMREAVSKRRMPPWHADPAHGKFSNDRSMTDAEIATIVEWAKSGAPEGNPKDAPKPLTFAEGWAIGKPDVVIEMGTDFTVPAKGKIEYTFFVAPTGFTEDKWIEKIEVRPGARSVVHHVVLLAREKGSPLWPTAKPGQAFVPASSMIPRNPSPDNGQGRFAILGGGVEVLSTYVPGGDPYLTRPGQARLIKAGSDLVFQMHYTADGKEAVDRTKVGIVFAKQPPKERVFNTFVMNNRLRIPAGAENHRVDAAVTIQSDVKVLAMFPHMHLRGKAMEYRAVLPNGETKVLLSVPRYDFNWQMTYEMAEPVTLPRGTKLEVTAWFDNSPNNPANPDPKVDVFWGEQSWEEMLAGFIDFVIPVDTRPIDVGRPRPAATPPTAP